MLIKKCLLFAGGLLAFPAHISCQTAPTQLAENIAPSGGMISASGSYYLGFDVMGDITIDVSNVILDLNGHLVTGSISVSPDLSDVAIMNGFVTTSVSDGIDVATGCSNIHLHNITIRYSSGNNGVTVTGGTNVRIKEVTCLGTGITMASVDGLALSGCSNAVVCNCTIVGDGLLGDGLSIRDDCQKILIQECRVSKCTTSFEITTGSEEVTVSNCIALSGSTGFFANVNGKSVQLLNCVAENHDTAGFSIGSQGEPVYLEECLAYNNSADGFSVNSKVAHVVKKCVAVGNDTGFNSVAFVGGDPVRYVANYANGNTTDNYDPSGAPFFEKAANDNGFTGMNFWRNALALT